MVYSSVEAIVDSDVRTGSGSEALLAVLFMGSGRVGSCCRKPCNTQAGRIVEYSSYVGMLWYGKHFYYKV